MENNILFTYVLAEPGVGLVYGEQPILFVGDGFEEISLVLGNIDFGKKKQRRSSVKNKKK